MAGLAIIIPRAGGTGPIIPDWTPASAGANLHTWLNPASGADGQAVTSWADASGNGHAATPGAGSVTFDSDVLGGFPGVVFGGAGYLKTAAFTSIGGSVTLLFNGRATGGATQYFTDGLSGNSAAVYRSVSGDSFSARRIGTPSTAAMSKSPSDGAAHSFVAVFDGASSALYVDGVKATGLQGAAGITGLTIGANGAGASILTGAMGDVVLILGAMTEADITKATAWLKLRRGAV